MVAAQSVIRILDRAHRINRGPHPHFGPRLVSLLHPRICVLQCRRCGCSNTLTARRETPPPT